MPSPRISVLLITYKHAKFIEEALRSILVQDYAGFELIIADDASPDSTREVIETVLRQSSRSDVTVRKIYQTQNLGLVRNVNAAMQAASGDIFVMAAGDDISLPSRITKIVKAFQLSPEIQLVCTNYQKIDERGNHIGSPPKRHRTKVFSYAAGTGDIYANSPICGATAAYRRNLFHEFGPMQPGTHGEDNCFWVRALLTGKIYYNESPLILWRQHQDNLSNSVDDNFATPESRASLIKWMKAHSQMTPQWERDISHALNSQYITKSEARQALWRAHYDAIKWEMQYCTLGVRPWAEWLKSAYRLLPYFQFDRLFRYFKERISARRRERIWQWWANHRRNH